MRVCALVEAEWKLSTRAPSQKTRASLETDSVIASHCSFHGPYCGLLGVYEKPSTTVFETLLETSFHSASLGAPRVYKHRVSGTTRSLRLGVRLGCGQYYYPTRPKRAPCFVACSALVPRMHLQYRSSGVNQFADMLPRSGWDRCGMGPDLQLWEELCTEYSVQENVSRLSPEWRCRCGETRQSQRPHAQHDPTACLGGPAQRRMSVQFDRRKGADRTADRPRIQMISRERTEGEWICGVHAGAWDASGVQVKLCISPLSRGKMVGKID